MTYNSHLTPLLLLMGKCACHKGAARLPVVGRPTRLPLSLTAVCRLLLYTRGQYNAIIHAKVHPLLRTTLLRLALRTTHAYPLLQLPCGCARFSPRVTGATRVQGMSPTELVSVTLPQLPPHRSDGPCRRRYCCALKTAGCIERDAK